MAHGFSDRSKPLERIPASLPVNKLAALVTSSGEAPIETDRVQGGYGKFDVCPPLAKFIGPRTHDLTGRRIGNLRVVGYFGPGKRNRGGFGTLRPGRWVVRCDCGTYEIRRTDALNKTLRRLQVGQSLANQDCTNCSRCAKVEVLKRRASSVKRDFH